MIQSPKRVRVQPPPQTDGPLLPRKHDAIRVPSPVAIPHENWSAEPVVASPAWSQSVLLAKVL